MSFSNLTTDADSGDIKRMTDQVLQSIQKYPQTGTKPWDYQIATKDLSYQVGSLVKLVMQLNKERFAHGLSPEEIKVEIAGELADILSLVLFIAHELKIDLNNAWAAMLTSDVQKISSREKL